MSLAVPGWAADRYDGTLCRPSLRVLADTAYFLVPIDVPAEAARIGSRVLGLDWGVRRLLTGAVCEPDPAQVNRVSTTGRPFYFSATGLQAKLYRLRAEAELLSAKVRQIDRLLAGLDESLSYDLVRRRAKLATIKDAAWTRLTNANRQLARAAATWATETAIAEGCATVSLEDLADLETRDLGRTTNGRVNLQVRGMLHEELAARCALRGIGLVLVAAAGTSSHCSRCGRRSVFLHGPDLPTHKGSNRKTWLTCICGRSSDRDHTAAESIAARALGAAVTAHETKSRRRSKPVRITSVSTADAVAATPRVRVRRDKRRRSQRLPLMLPQLAARPRDERSPRRVGRGTVVAARQAVLQDPASSTPAPRTARILDGLCGGYRNRVRFTRIRSLAPPPAQVYAGY
jgi:transposase